MKNILPVVFLILFSVICINSFASTKIVLTAPGYKEIVVKPRGNAKCHVIPKGFYDGVWHERHKVCNYGRARGSWVAAHWQCTKLNQANRCVRWDYVPSQWQGKKVAVYGNPSHHSQIVHAKPPVYVKAQPKPVASHKPHVAVTITS